MSTPKSTKGWIVEAERRRILRHKLDLNLKTVAYRIGISPTSLHRYERGHRRPGRDVDICWRDALIKEAP